MSEKKFDLYVDGAYIGSFESEAEAWFEADARKPLVEVIAADVPADNRRPDAQLCVVRPLRGA